LCKHGQRGGSALGWVGRPYIKRG